MVSSSDTAICGGPNFVSDVEEGQKDRPCVVILVTSLRANGDRVIAVLPMTHTPPTEPALAIEISPATKQRLHLDEARSRIGLSEANRFVWPGPDLRPRVPGDAGMIAYGVLPFRLTTTVQRSFMALLKSRRIGLVARTEP